MYNVNIFGVVLIGTIFTSVDATLVRSRSISTVRHEENDGYTFSNELFVTPTESLLACSAICVCSEACITASFNVLDKMCMIYDRIYPDPEISELVSPYAVQLGWRAFRVSPCHKCPAYRGYSCIRSPALSCYKYYNKSDLKYGDSRQQCIDDGGALMRIDSAKKQKLAEDILDAVSYGEVWIQGRRSSGQWSYDDNSPFTYSNWNTGEGLNSGSPVVFIRKSQGYKWHDSEPWKKFGSLCEVEL